MYIKLKSYIVSAKSYNSMFDQVFIIPPNLTWNFQMFSNFSSFLLKQASILVWYNDKSINIR